jgi:hypothetical protein
MSKAGGNSHGIVCIIEIINSENLREKIAS